jgi:endogenous inhibitor of DNA gyrase (YacG/DUF329 family)
MKRCSSCGADDATGKCGFCGKPLCSDCHDLYEFCSAECEARDLNKRVKAAYKALQAGVDEHIENPSLVTPVMEAIYKAMSELMSAED